MSDVKLIITSFMVLAIIVFAGIGVSSIQQGGMGTLVGFTAFGGVFIFALLLRFHLKTTE